MSRPLRLEIEGAFYHITSRGDRLESIFDDDTDRRKLLDVVGQSAARFDVTVLAYCLMSNHYHFVLQTHQPNLSRLMRHINGVYTQSYNRRHRKVGHLFQGRFKAVLVDSDAYLLEVCRYVDLNPVRAGLVESPSDWFWSSYRSHAGSATRAEWLDSSMLYRQLLPGEPGADSPACYARFVSQGVGVRLWDNALLAQVYLGDDAFLQRMQAHSLSSDAKEIPRIQRHSTVPALQWYFDRFSRNEAIVKAFIEGAYTQTAIAKVAELSVSRISKLIKASEAKVKT
jgi:putative transposase